MCKRMQTLAKTIFLYALAFCWAFAGAEQSDPLGLNEALKSSNVVVIGWAHVPENSSVIQFIEAQLEELAKRNVVIALERDPFLMELGLVGMDGGLTRDLAAKARAKGIEVVGIDDFEYRQKATLPQIDRMFSRSLVKIARSGRPVVFLVGRAHVSGIARAFRFKRIRLSTIETKFDHATGDVELNGTLISRLDLFRNDSFPPKQNQRPIPNLIKRTSEAFTFCKQLLMR